MRHIKKKSRIFGVVETKIGCNFSSEIGTVDGWKVKLVDKKFKWFTYVAIF